MTTLEIIKDLCAKENISLSALEKEMGYGNGSLSKAIKIPSDRIFELSMRFGKPMEYFMTGKDKWQNIKQSMSELDAFDAELESLGWKCELVSCRAWEEVKIGANEGTPVSCTLPNGKREKCNECYMKTPKYVFSNGSTSFEVSSEDYSAFLQDSKTFFLKRIQKLMIKSTSQLFEVELRAAHNDFSNEEGQQELMQQDLDEL